MDVLEPQVTGVMRLGRFVVEAAILAAIILIGESAAAQSLAAPDLKAAFLFNFTQFVEWPVAAVPAGSSLALCTVNDDAVADALERIVKGRNVFGHDLTIRRLAAGTPTTECHVLYLGGGDLKRLPNPVETSNGAFVLTVSDSARFAQKGGMVEFFLEDGHMRFAVNVDALQRAQVRLSSRVLGLAKIVKDAKSP